MLKKSRIFISLFAVLLIVVSISKPIIDRSESISTKVFRLHILANSDSDFDQELKLSVKDAILENSAKLFQSSSTLSQAIESAQSNIDTFRNIAKSVIEENGYTYNVDVTIDKEYFDTRYYDSFIMPAGMYNTLKIVIGEGKGHNWWCVMYPSVCISGCIDDFDKELSAQEKELLTSNKFIPKFKIIELYESIKNKILS